jgi:Family of unknown function (DUF5670)
LKRIYQAAFSISSRKKGRMLLTIALILAALWLIGLFVSYTMGGLIHILLVLAIVISLLRVVRRKKISDA